VSTVTLIRRSAAVTVTRELNPKRLSFSDFLPGRMLIGPWMLGKVTILGFGHLDSIYSRIN